MSTAKAIPASRYSIGAKSFLLGEYAVSAGKAAAVATFGPRFELRVSAGATAPEASPFAEKSPAGKLIAWAREQRVSVPGFEFVDPFSGQGGFGASTAQFALVYAALAERAGWAREWSRVWSLYRELMSVPESEIGLPPSGADLVAQWQGSVGRVLPSSSWQDLGESLDWSRLWIFSAAGQAGRKVATHEHLSKLAQMGFPDGCPELIAELEKPLIFGLERIRADDLEGFGKAMRQYADVLRQAGFECDATFEDRQALSKISGVLAVKGTGALQADGILMLISPDVEEGSSNESQILSAAKQRGLTLVTRGISPQEGWKAESTEAGR